MSKWLLVLLVMTGCASNLPAHRWMPISRVIGVDLFWWKDQQLCQIRVIYEGGSTGAAGFTTTVDSSLCLDWIKNREADQR